MKKVKSNKLSVIIYTRAKETDIPQKTQPAFLREEYLKHSTKVTKQEEVCRDYCKENNLNIVGIFSDANVSAVDMERKGLRDAISYCEKHKGRVDAVIVTSMDRISRSYDSFVALMRCFSGYGVDITSVLSGNVSSDRFAEAQMLPLQ